MKKILIPFFLTLCCFYLSGQQSSFENENGCTLPSNLIADITCSTDWYAANGSPDIVHQNSSSYLNPPITPPDGSFFAAMYYQARFDQIICRNESMFWDVGTLNSGEKYLLTFSHRLTGSGLTINGDPTPVQIGYTSGLSHVNASGLQFCNDFGNDVIEEFSPFSSNNWVEEAITFVADSRDQIGFAPIPDVQNADGIYLVDDVELVACYDLTPDFTFVDENGDEVDEYCFGEDVYIMINDVDYWIGQYYMSAESNGVYLGAGWQNQVSAGGPWNISQIFRDEGLDPFTPDQTWNFKLAVNHPDCGWVQRVKPFEYVCCDIDAGFIFESTELPAPYDIELNATTDYSDYGGTHEFCLYTDQDNDNDFEVVTCSSSPSLLVNNLQAGVRYYITHFVSTPCGDFCESYDFCQGSGCDGQVSMDPCDVLIPPTCENTAPTGLVCPRPRPTEGGNGNSFQYNLSWDPTPGAFLHELEVTQADPECGCNQPQVSYIDHWRGVYLIDGNAANIIAGDCFSYRVRVLCPSGEWSPWSDKVCVPQCSRGGGEPRPRNSEEFGEVDMHVYPNPFSHEINIKLSNSRTDNSEIHIYSHVGQLVDRWTIQSMSDEVTTTWRPSEEITAGLYIIRMIDGENIINKKVIYQK